MPSENSAERVSFALGEDGVARVTLCAPERRNAIDPRWVAEFATAVGRCADERGVRAVLVAADGPAFSVGGDLAHFATRRADLDVALEEMVPAFHDALGDLAHLPVPVVAAVQGAVAGGGLGLAWVADLVLARDDARLAAGFDRLGLSGDGGSSWWLPRLVGLRRAQQMLVGGRVLDATTALEWGLVSEVVPGGELRARAEARTAALAAGPTAAYGRMRGLLQAQATSTLREQLAAETAAMVASGATGQAREGVAAFAQRRPPTFDPDEESHD